MATKREKLNFIQQHPDFALELMTYGANHMLQQLLTQNLIKVDPKTGKRPNKAACHPMILQALRRDIELLIEAPNG